MKKIKDNDFMSNQIEKKIYLIPRQLQKKEFGFVKLKHKSKAPFEAKWQKKTYTFQEINEWIKSGNNYGVIGGSGSLAIIDGDSPEICKIVKEELPKTFTVKTPKKGYHFYYICKGLTGKIVLQTGSRPEDHYGEILSFGSQAVGAGSIHPETNTPYVVDNNVDIAEITKEEIYRVFKDYITGLTKKEKTNQDQKKETYQDYYDLVQQYGEPYYFNNKGGLTSINQLFWAGLHNIEHIELYEPIEKTFYHYDEQTGLYREISEDRIRQEISTKLLQVSREQALSALEQKRTNQSLIQITSQLKGIAEKKNVFVDKQKIIHLANGVIEFKNNNTADFVTFSPSFYSRNNSPVFFDENAKCERFLNEFLRPALQDDDIVLLQKYTGLCLLGNNLVQRFLILDGKEGRGKSTLSLIIQKLIGSDNVSELRTRHLGERFELYRYRKKTLLVGVDVPGNFLSEKGAPVIKGLVGGDWYDAEQKAGTGNFPIKGNYCIIITSNSKLHVKLDGDHGAWERRLLIIEFNGPKPQKKIPNFEEILLKEEASGILNWALEGLALLFQDIDTIGDVFLSERQKNTVERLLAESDSLRHFLQESITSNPSGNLTVNEIIEAYSAYCPDMGWNPKPLPVLHKEISALMLELFQTAKSHSIMRSGTNVRGFNKVSFKGNL